MMFREWELEYDGAIQFRARFKGGGANSEIFFLLYVTIYS